MLTLTDAQMDSIRLLTGQDITVENLSNDQIRTGILLGEASDYVFRNVIANVNPITLSNNLQADAIRRASAYDTIEKLKAIDLDHFVVDALTDEQAILFRSAVMYRTAGSAMTTLAPGVVSEGATAIGSDTYSETNWQIVQSNLFAHTDELIQRIIEELPNDPYPEEKDIVFFGV